MFITFRKPKVIVYTDGSYRPQTGIGGYAAYLQCGNNHLVISDTVPHTTNNRMELQAVCSALQCLKIPSDITIYTDSQYVIHAFEKYYAYGCLTHDVANADLIETMMKYAIHHDIRMEWVKGHGNNAGNIFVDAHAYIRSANGALGVRSGIRLNDRVSRAYV